MHQKSGFRLDINGLRAWAVVAVMLYHFEIPGFRGGFVGVDIFFVISGFLMTGIVRNGLQKETFLFIEFISARARRIAPALMVLCAALMTLGWFTLPPADYKSLASHSVYSLLFVSNIEYWLSAGYFDSTSHEKWLLHTWSLSVEWQFYLILPVLLWAAWKARPGLRFQGWTIGACLLASLCAALILSPRDNTASFYLIHTRAWELLAGGVLCQLRPEGVSPRWRKILALSGLSLIATSIVSFSPETLWPYFWTIVPVAGTMLVIFSNQRLAFTHHPLAQWIGERSYSLYLWHWPVFVVLVTLEWRDRPFAVPAGLITATLLAAMSYRFVELPSRIFLAKHSAKANIVQIASAAAVVSMAGLMIWKVQGAPSRLPEAAKLIMAEQQKLPTRAQECEGTFGVATPLCEYGQAQRKILIVGDSHVQPMLSAATAALPNVTWIPISYVGCPFIQGLKLNAHATPKRHLEYNCEAHNQWVQETISNSPSSYPILLVGRYAIQAFGVNETGLHQGIPLGYISQSTQQPTPESINELAMALTNTACELARHRQVFMLRPTPEMTVNVPTTAIRRIMFGTPTDIHVSMSEYLARNEWVWKAQNAAKEKCGVVILDPTPAFCPNNQCQAIVDGLPAYRDHNHLSEHGSRLLIPTLKLIAGHVPPKLDDRVSVTHTTPVAN